ncbi:nuclear transport factor 2 family protein [Saccharothrix sp. SC076]|nr:nuclear transport factor 2 family protein [Saccharothrix obliqua]
MDNLPAPIRQALNAANQGDTDAFLNAFTETGAVDDWGREFRGHEAIRRWSDAEFIGKRVTIEVSGIKSAGDTTTVSSVVGGDGFNGVSDFEFTTADDRITLMRITG